MLEHNPENPGSADQSAATPTPAKQPAPTDEQRDQAAFHQALLQTLLTRAAQQAEVPCYLNVLGIPISVPRDQFLQLERAKAAAPQGGNLQFEVKTEKDQQSLYFVHLCGIPISVPKDQFIRIKATFEAAQAQKQQQTFLAGVAKSFQDLAADCKAAEARQKEQLSQAEQNQQRVEAIGRIAEAEKASAAQQRFDRTVRSAAAQMQRRAWDSHDEITGAAAARQGAGLPRKRP